MVTADMDVSKSIQPTVFEDCLPTCDRGYFQFEIGLGGFPAFPRFFTMILEEVGLAQAWCYVPGLDWLTVQVIMQPMQSSRTPLCSGRSVVE